MHSKGKNKNSGGDFRNDPFRGLKGITTRSAAPSKKPPLRVAAPKEEEESEQLFLRAAAGARRVVQPDEEGAGPQPGPTNADRPPSPAESGEKELFHQAMHMLGAASFSEQQREPADDDAEVRRSASSRMRRLKRGAIRIAEELDLHGCLRDDAIRRLAHFIGNAYALGREAVLVITGKGLNSPDGPVLQGAVREWLRTAGAKMVAEFHDGPRDKGGSGAVVVFLRRRA
jgi:DNA-nicking Smr family endonuclease